MEFQVGAKVVHRSYGPGEVLELARRVIAGRLTDCFAVKVGELVVYVPNDAATNSLRVLTPAAEFNGLFSILSEPGGALANDRFERRSYLLEQMKAGTLQATCHVIRDLYDYRQANKVNDQDTAVLQRALRFLLEEWEIVMGVPSRQAEAQLGRLLGKDADTFLSRLHRI